MEVECGSDTFTAACTLRPRELESLGSRRSYKGDKPGRCATLEKGMQVESSWNVMAHGDAREGKGRGNWRMEWVASTLHSTSELVYPASLPLMRTPRLPVVDCTDAPAVLNGRVRFAERRNLVSARVSSRFKRSLTQTRQLRSCTPNRKVCQ